MAKSRAQLDAEIAGFLAKATKLRRTMPPSTRSNTPDELAKRARIQARIRKLEAQVASRRPASPKYPVGTGVWRVLDD
jgi:hypothetical protein